VLWTYAALIAIWPLRHLVLAIILPRLHVLTPRSPKFAAPGPPLVSAIIPARDEEANLPGCLASVCAQTYPNLEILVADDRSDDGTAEVVRKFAARDPRVRLIHIDELPHGWTGKNHALHVASTEARGDSFWFLDADTRHHPDSLAIVMEYARAQGASMTSLLPRQECASFWEWVVQPLEGVVLIQSYPPLFVNNDRMKRAFANGQYILVGRSAYEAAGGHLAVRDRLLEDIALARRIKGLGLPIRVAIGKEIGTTRMYSSLRQLVRGWARILYDALGRSPWPLIGKILDPLVFSQTGHVALIVAVVLLLLGHPSPFAWWLLGLSLAHHLLAATLLFRLYRLTGDDARSVVFYPLAGLVNDVILFKALLMCLTGRVTWRGTAYGPRRSRRVPEGVSKAR
jgi:glycosyltransferase involved in cell wall biosynthesis